MRNRKACIMQDMRRAAGAALRRSNTFCHLETASSYLVVLNREFQAISSQVGSVGWHWGRTRHCTKWEPQMPLQSV